MPAADQEVYSCFYNMFVADKNIMYSWAAQNSSQRVNIFQ
ncbi:hypothetical protein EUBHAL_01125 [Anaerobutyricum hallii DSM 3353]|uniref:Uncharacterized protein n=1 Tax=Anaerobutyricum hallii DSM 3353 TaxID=411469 RepID=C0EUN9_9FIRM|nr:hypothetical protein EUBHAL_01125 [Anaerobutyricum hallii DSM 3353]